MSPTVQAESSFRKRYLLETLHLNYDPFANFKAELDLAITPADPLFYLYFVEPGYKPNNGPLLTQLRKPGPAVIGGDPGSGKTMLRYVLEQACRTSPDGTLVVSPPFDSIAISDRRPERIQQKISEAIATDLFVQVMDQHHLFEFNRDLTHALASYWRAGIPGFVRKLRLYLETTTSVEMSAWWWPTWQRPAVRFTPDTPKRREFLRRLVDHESLTSDLSELDPQESIRIGLQLAHDLAFTQLFLLLDMDDDIISVKTIVQTIGQLDDSTLITPVYPKFFLPSTLQAQTVTLLQQTFLQFTVFSGIIIWEVPDKLVSLIAKRFRAGRSWVRDFDTLASQEISGKLQDALVSAAQKSPRRLLQLINSLIEAHASQTPDDPLITADDWQRMRITWGYGNPIPASLPGTHQGSIMPNGEQNPRARRNFEFNLAVKRDRELGIATNWLNNSPRLLTVVGPPAVGKTWFLYYLERVWGWEGQPVFRLDTAGWLDFPPEVSRVGNGQFNETKARQDIARLADSARKKCPTIPHSDNLAELSAVVEYLAHALARCWPGSRIILLIDGGDEATASSWRRIEREVLEPFARELALRFVVALRDDWALQVSSLRYEETRLPLSSLINPEGREQIRKLLVQGSRPEQPDDLLQLLPGYTWSHPGLNTFLFEDWQSHNFAGLGNDLLTRGLQALLEIAPPQLTDIRGLLTRIDLDMADAWIPEDLKSLLNTSISAAWDRIEELRKFGLLTTERNRHKIIDGVREFLRAANHMAGAA